MTAAPVAARAAGLRIAAATFTLILGLYIAAHTIWMDLVCWSAMPFGDQWSEIVTGRDITWSWLVSQHVEHRLIFPRLVFLADSRFAAETNIVNYSVNFAIQAGLALWLFRFSDAADLADRIGRIWKAGLCLALLFWAGQYQNFVWGFQSQFFGVILAAFATFAVVATGRSRIWLAGALMLETIAVYCLASGVMVPFFATGLAALAGRPKKSVAILAVAACSLLALYLWGYHTPTVSADPLSAWRHIPGIAAYTLIALGAPVGNIVLLHARLPAGLAVSAAAGMLIAYIYARSIWTALRARIAVPPHQAALMGFAAFLLAMLLITASGRYVKGIESALVSRYTTPAGIFWCCVCLLAAARARGTTRLPAAVMLAVLPVPLLMALTEASNVTIARDWVALRRAATPAFLANVADLTMYKLVYAVEPDGIFENSAAARMLPGLRTAHHAVFAAEWARWLGTPLQDHVASIDRASCAGSIGTALKVADAPTPGWRITGQAWLTQSGTPVDRLLIVDKAGRVAGYGLGGLDLAAMDLAGPYAAHENADWIGAFSGAAPEAVQIYALTGEKGACPIGTPKPGS